MSHRVLRIGSGWLGGWLVKLRPNETTASLHVFSTVFPSFKTLIPGLLLHFLAP